MRNVAPFTETIYMHATEGYQLTSSNSPGTTENSDANLILFLCLFGIIIVLLSCLAGNASYLVSKCRSASPNIQGRQDDPLSRERNSQSQIDASFVQQNNINTITTNGSCFNYNNINPNIDKNRSRSCYDKTLFYVDTSKRRDIPVPPAPIFNLQRMTSLSDGCICHRTTEFHPSFRLENIQIENYENRGPNGTVIKSPEGDSLCNAPYGIKPYSNTEDIYNDVESCRARLESEFTLERDRFLSNALKMRPSKNISKRRLSSQFSYQRDRFLSNAVKNATLDEQRQGLRSPNRRSRIRTGTMTSIFSLTRRYTRSFSGLSLSTAEDVFMNEHIYETISLDNLRLNSVDETIDEPFPTYAKSTKTSAKEANGHDHEDRPRKEGNELPTLYIALDEMSQFQRRCSLPSPTEAIDMGFDIDSSYVSHRLANLLASSSFRSEGHISGTSSKINPFDIC